ncbi:MAG: peptidoglycan DD-metalloendopeptidase family protein [Gammaproteobacteria bacterium]|nr:peptidoglycan DD-metalloendopeptidase family protein [Gammaproteobacteria bacterium]
MALLACGGKALRWEPRVHVVRSGEVLQTIAFRYGIDLQQLAAWNRIDNPDLIFEGQKIRLSPPSGYRPATKPVVVSRPAEPGQTGVYPAVTPGWIWPADGRLIARYGDATSIGQGIDIGGNSGNPVRAAAAGEVVYSGSGLLGYGKLIILKHNESFLSAYGHNKRLLVSEGQTVTAGQQIGEMGVGPGDRALLHFEIRIKGKPVDPLQYLPTRVPGD